MKKTTEEKPAPAVHAGAALHKSTLDADEVALLNSLPTGAARAERAKLTQAETLMDEETLAGSNATGASSSRRTSTCRRRSPRSRARWRSGR